MFSQKIGAKSHDLLAKGVLLRPARERLDRKVALGVEAHGAVVQIRRSYPHQPIIHDEDLGVHVDGRAPLRDRIVEPEPPVGIGPLNESQHPGA